MTGGYRRGGWDEWLERLEEEAGGTPSAALLDRIADRVLDKARLARGDSVMDLGAGHGLLAVRAARAVGPGGIVVAVDSDPGCLEELRRRCDTMKTRNVLAVDGRMEDLPLESRKHNAAVCRSALSYSVDLQRSVSEISRVLAEDGRFSVFEPLTGEMTWSAGKEDPFKDFLRMERILVKERESFALDRGRVRRAFAAAGLGANQSLVVRYNVTFEGLKPDDILREYLYDLPGELAAVRVLRRRFPEEEVVYVASRFALAASAGDVEGRLPCLFLWGAKNA